MGLGDVLSVSETNSPSRLNAKTTIWTDALTLSNLPTTPCMRVVPTTTGYGFVTDVALRRKADNLAWLVDGLAKHFHATDTDLDGGALTEVLFANMGQVIDLNLMNAKVTDFVTTTSGTGAQVIDNVGQSLTSKISMDAGTTSGGYAKINKYGLTPAFGSRSKYQIAMNISLDTNMLFRSGIGGEGVDVSNNSLRKYGIEGCSSAPEGLVILVFSADNTTRSTQASVAPIVSSTSDSYIVQHSPSLNIKMIKGALENVTTKPSNIPSSGTIGNISGDDHGVIKAGIKTTTASQNKTMNIWGQRFVANAGDARWSQVLWQ
jgi:hypothetical protein